MVSEPTTRSSCGIANDSGQFDRESGSERSYVGTVESRHRGLFKKLSNGLRRPASMGRRADDPIDVHAPNVNATLALWTAHRSRTREPLVGPGGIVGYPIGLYPKATY